MPAILVEPLFCNNPQHCKWICSEEGQNRLARILGESIQRFFPNGGLVGFSVGHKYKTSQPNDLGAAVHSGGWEADFAEKVLLKAAKLMQAIDHPPTARQPRVMQGETVLWTYALDDDAEVRWDPVQGLLQIR
jgi:hypothetical protein